MDIVKWEWMMVLGQPWLPQWVWLSTLGYAELGFYRRPFLHRRSGSLYGGLIFNFDAFVRIARDFLQQQPPEIGVVPLLAQNVAMLEWMVRLRREGKIPMIDFLRIAHSSLASASKDKVFGIYSLASDVKDYAQLDYKMSVETIYTEVASTTVSLRHNQLSNVLSLAGLHKQGLKLPSWVPDWSRVPTLGIANFMEERLIDDNFQIQVFTPLDFYGPSHPLRIVHDDNHSILHPKGQLLDVIVNLGPANNPPLEGINNGRSKHAEWILSTMDILMDGPGIDDSQFEEAVTGGLFIEESSILKLKVDVKTSAPSSRIEEHQTIPAAMNGVANITHLLSQLLQPSKKRALFTNTITDEFVTGKRPRPHKARTIFESSKMQSDVTGANYLAHLFTQDINREKSLRGLRYLEPVEPALQHTTFRRRLCVSANGNCGIVPECTVEGDFLAVLDGIRCPVVLRSCGDDFIFVGDAYLTGGDSGWDLKGEALDIRLR